ncbi:MAG TPA: DUF3180 domain-containing protein [Aquiluna sp.]
MKPISYRVFFGTALISVLLSINIVQLFAGFGQSYPQSPITLIVTMPVIGIAVVLATLPIRRYRNAVENYSSGPRPERPDPFYALRALVLSRATALAGTIFVGWHLGALIWLVVFSVAPIGPVTLTSIALLGSIAMLAGGLIGQSNCKAPRDSDGEGLA